MKLFALLLIFVVQGCAMVAQNLDDTLFYRRDITLKINGVKASGATVVPEAPSYRIEGETKGTFDFLFVRSCHREYTAERQGDDFVYTYTPRAGIEDNRACPLEIRGVEKVKGRHSFGFVDFQNRRDRLDAVLECNGSRDQYAGVSVCQAPESLIQRIIFPVEVYAESIRPECKMPEPKDLKNYEFKMPPKSCQVVFMEKASPHRTHRLTTLGYERVVIKEY